MNLDTAELAVACGDKDPVTILKMKKSGSRNHGTHLPSLSLQHSRGKHANPHQPVGIINLDSDLRRAYRWIKHRSYIGNRTGKDAGGICIEANLCALAHMNRRKIILINVAYHPDTRKVSDGEGG